MAKSITISFVGTSELKALLEKWAAEDDRSVSYILRNILKQESKRRQAYQRTDKAQTS
jgi:predicted transcriptional regulator